MHCSFDMEDLIESLKKIILNMTHAKLQGLQFLKTQIECSYALIKAIIHF